jgi:hypothetical protein
MRLAALTARISSGEAPQGSLGLQGDRNLTRTLTGPPFIDHLGFWRILIFVAQDRRAHRHFVLKAGTIVFGRNVIDCVVRNLSTSGAALEAPNQTGIPSRFVLVIPSDGLRLACRVKWRKEHRIGVE